MHRDAAATRLVALLLWATACSGTPPTGLFTGSDDMGAGGAHDGGAAATEGGSSSPVPQPSPGPTPPGTGMPPMADASSPPPSGADASAPSGTDSGNPPTGSTPSTPDAESPQDAGGGAPDDAGGGTPDDAGGESPPDAGTTGPSGGIPCGADSCHAPSRYCCVSGGIQQGGQHESCASSPNDCNGPGTTPIRCSSSAQCPSREVCCGVLFDGREGQYYSEVACQPQCGGGGGSSGAGGSASQFQFCDPAIPSDCPRDMRCVASVVVDGYSVCM
jgi:hypothetical protein